MGKGRKNGADYAHCDRSCGPVGHAGRVDVPPGPDICVINNEEIGGRTYARFARNGQPWPNRDWGVDIDSFCFFKN
jgi:hypothetical protein